MGRGLWVEGLGGESVTLEFFQGGDKSVKHLKQFFLFTGLATMSPIWKKSPKGKPYEAKLVVFMITQDIAVAIIRREVIYMLWLQRG